MLKKFFNNGIGFMYDPANQSVTLLSGLEDDWEVYPDTIKYFETKEQADSYIRELEVLAPD